MTYNDRAETMATIKAELKKRSGKPWSVTGGRGTAYGWLTITAPPARRVHGDLVGMTPGWTPKYPPSLMTDTDAAELAGLLGMPPARSHQGVMVAASHKHYAEFVDRAKGLVPVAVAQPYWD
jgi:hypothetical protein